MRFHSKKNTDIMVIIRKNNASTWQQYKSMSKEDCDDRKESTLEERTDEDAKIMDDTSSTKEPRRNLLP
jgi:hypothetical protein